jgi:ribosomal protein S3/ribosomal protein L21E
MSVVEKKTLDYTVDFPKLPDAPSATSTSSSVTSGAWTGSTQPAIKSSIVTEAFKLGAEERASRNGDGRTFGGPASEEQQKCNQIAQLTGTKIELNEAKDQSITILITGKQKNVEDARTRLVRELQTQATVRLEIPKEYHSFIIGKQGSKLHQLEQKFLCRINMPNRDDKSSIIKIVGPNEYIVEAAKEIKSIADEMAKQKTEHLNIPRSFYPWIRGVNNEILDDLIHRTGVKINIPPLQANSDNIIISGERDGVDAAVAELSHIYQDKKESVVSFEITVKKPQHRFIIGRKRAGLDEIFRDTETLVEVPPEDSDSERIILRGPKDKIGDAAGSVYLRATSTIAAEVHFQDWMRRYLLGHKGANLQTLVPNQEKLRIDFEDCLIYIEGPPEDVIKAQQQLTAEITRLENELCCEMMQVATTLHRFIIGKSGSVVNKLKEEYDVLISVPNESSNSDQIRLEGKKENVKKVREAINELLQVHQKRQQQVAANNAQRSQAAQNNNNNNTRSDGSLSNKQGPVHEQTQGTVRVEVPKEYHSFIIGKQGSKLHQLEQKYSCRIHMPNRDEKSDVIRIVGPNDLIVEAANQIKSIGDDMAKNKTEHLNIPRAFYPWIRGINNEKLDDLIHRTGVKINIPPLQANNETIIISGERQGVDTAAAEINNIYLDKKDSVVTREISFSKHLHRFIVGRRRTGLDDIFRDTETLVEVPPEDSDSERIILRGPKDKIGEAEAAVNLRANDTITKEVHFQDWMRRYLIGPKGANLQNLVPHQEKLRIDFEDCHLLIEGLSEDVNKAESQLCAEIVRLENEYCSQVMHVDPNLHKFIIGKSGSVVNKLKKEYDVQISVPNESLKSDLIRFEGKKENVEKVKEAIIDLIEIQQERHQAIINNAQRLQAINKCREPSPPPKSQQNVEITGAPWQIDSLEQFPTIGTSNGNGSSTTTTTKIQQAPLVGGHVWGQRR